MTASSFLKGLALGLACLIKNFETTSGENADTHQDFHGKSLMKDLSIAFDGMEKGIAASDPQRFSRHAKAMEETAKAILSLKPTQNQDLQAAFNDCRAKVLALSSEIAALSEKQHLGEAEQALEEIRRTCVTCHLKFREGNKNSGLYPARGNTIFGQVKVLSADGKEVMDCSNVVVFLDKVKSDSAFPLPRKNPVISQKKHCFFPRVLPILKGTTVDFPNDDAIFHNVFSLSAARPFDLDIYEPGRIKFVHFPNAGVVKVYCNIHPDMISNIIVLNNPYFAVTDKKGFYVIAGVPDGDYPLRIWHERGGEARKEVSVYGSALHVIPVEIAEKSISIKHRNKFGKPYPEKY
ncbi:MAG: hypothetical protein HY717_15620 [Planctomycetes bacterium]|nr:hypothetical protein [Planctomycetota bacterium]